MAPRLLVPPALALFLGPALAGCLAGPGLDAADVDPAALVALDWAERALPDGPDHTHTDPAQHADLSTPNFQVVGHEPLVSPTLGRTAGGHFCGDAQATPDGRRIAAVEARGVGGFVVADVTDPANPKMLGEFIMRSSRVYDVAVVADGRHVALVTTDQLPVGVPPLSAPARPDIAWRSACAGAEPAPLRWDVPEDPLARPSSLILVSIENPAAPSVVDQRPIPAAGHSVFSTRIDGRTWVLATVTASAGRYHQFYEVLATPAGGKLHHLSTYLVPTGDPVQPSTQPPRLVQGHDGWIAEHPATGRTLAYLAGGEDLTILDLANPLAPAFVGSWSDWSPERGAYTGHLHSVLPRDDLWDGRHYTVLGPEYGGQPAPQPSGTLWVLDTTDPARPVEVGAWTLPFEAEWNGTYMFSNHYFTIHGKTLFVSMYHGGVWAVDLSVVAPGGFALLPSVGVFLPDRASPKPPAVELRWTPTVEDVIAFPDGSIVLFDGSSGLYVVRFDDGEPAPPPVPWPIERPHSSA